MNPAYHSLVITPLTGNLQKDIYNFLVNNNCPKTAAHSIQVGKEARRIAERFKYKPDSAEIAGYLHDISAVYPNGVRISIAEELGIEVLPEERAFPMIIHQKISKFMARDLFQITDPEILDAVGCHTTLRKHSTLLDKIVFVADKVEWDQPGQPPYLTRILKKLDNSIEQAAFEYIQYLWDQREHLRVVHPWLKEAYYEFKGLAGIADLT